MFIDINQATETDEWLALRVGKVTSSGLSKVMANFGKAFGPPAKEYAAKVALEQITGKSNGDHFMSAHMERGHIEEPIARALYEEKYFCEVSNGGFFDNGKTGDSPDGLLYKDGVLEIKSVIGHVQLSTIKRGGFDPKYKWQLVFHLRETGRDWVDYVSFSSDFPEGDRLYDFRVDRDFFKEEFKMVDERLEEFFLLVEANKKVILGE